MNHLSICSVFWTKTITVLLVVRLTLLFIPVYKAQRKTANVTSSDELPHDCHLDNNQHTHQRSHQHNTHRHFTFY